MILWLAAWALAGDAPEISRSVGEEGGLVVLWPRVVPASEDPEIVALAADVQRWLAAQGERTGRLLDVRPAPERACPRVTHGCRAPTMSAVLAHQDGGCALVGLLSGPGESSTELLAWVGRVQVAAPTVPFREPPESVLRVADFVPCGEVRSLLDQRADAFADGLRRASLAADTHAR